MLIGMKTIIKLKIKKFIPSRVYLLLANLNKSKSFENFQEKYISFGEHNHKGQLFIIRRRPPGAGLFSNMNHVLQGLIRAENLERLPVVDMENYPTTYSRISRFHGTKNAWEYFFQPVSHVTLTDAYQSKNVILSRGDRILENHAMSGRRLTFTKDKELLNYLHATYTKYIKLNNFVTSYIDYILIARDIDINSTLGVFVRGSGYGIGDKGHPIQPKIEEVIDDINSYIRTKSIRSIFLSTEDTQIRELFRNAFAKQLIASIRSDGVNDFSKLLRNKFAIPQGQIAQNLSYLSEIYILAKFRYSFAALTNGSAILHVINGNQFEYSKLYDYGVR